MPSERNFKIYFRHRYSVWVQPCGLDANVDGFDFIRTFLQPMANSSLLAVAPEDQPIIWVYYDE